MRRLYASTVLWEKRCLQ